MLLPEARIDVLIEQLDTLPRGDRKAILARLSRAERIRLTARSRAAQPARPVSPYSASVAERLEALKSDGEMAVTPAGREALARAAEALKMDSSDVQGGSLFDTLVGFLQPDRGRR